MRAGALTFGAGKAAGLVVEPGALPVLCPRIIGPDTTRPDPFSDRAREISRTELHRAAHHYPFARAGPNAQIRERARLGDQLLDRAPEMRLQRRNSAPEQRHGPEAEEFRELGNVVPGAPHLALP